MSPRRHSPALPRAGRRLALAALAVAAFLLASASPAAADVAFDDSNPRDGAELTSWPSQVRLNFDGDLQAEFVTVAVARDGTPVDDTDIKVNGGAVDVTVPPAILETDGGAGDWQISYRVVAADGHPLTGAITFTVAAPNSPASPSTTPTDTTPTESTTTGPADGDSSTPAVPEDAASAAPDAPEESDESGASSNATSTIIIGALVAALTLGATYLLWRARRNDTSTP